MIYSDKAFSGFSVNDLEVAKTFYQDILGVKVEQNEMGLKLIMGNNVFVYQKDDHKPATFTILNFPVDNIDTAVAELRDKGVTFEKYEGLTNEQDIARGLDYDRGPNIAWFKDPAGNILSVLQDK